MTVTLLRHKAALKQTYRRADGPGQAEEAGTDRLAEVRRR